MVVGGGGISPCSLGSLHMLKDTIDVDKNIKLLD